MLTFHGVLVGYLAAVHSPTVDEPAHLAAGVVHWKAGTFKTYCVNPPLIRLVAAIPVVLAEPRMDVRTYEYPPVSRGEFALGRALFEANSDQASSFIVFARWACIPFSILGGVVCYRWASALYGQRSGLVALTLWSISPNVLAHASLITPDVGASAFGLCASYLFWRWLRRPTCESATYAGVALGAALLSKATWVVLLPLWPAAWVVWTLSHPRAPAMAGDRPGLVSQLVELVTMAVFGIALLNTGYGFEGSFRPLREYHFHSRFLAGDTDPDVANRFRESWMGSVYVPFPTWYVKGLDLQKVDFERGIRSYLCGQWRNRGWWYYYIVALLVKEPLGTWLLLVIASLGCGCMSVAQGGWRNEFVLLLTPVVILVVVSSQTGFSHHLRYVLPALPFLYIWSSRAIARHVRCQRTLCCSVLVAVLLTIASSLSCFPHMLSYFNEVSGGPRCGHTYLVDSNIDWGQDLPYLREWCLRNPQARPLSLAYFGQVNPARYGIVFETPCSPGERSSGQWPAEGWYAVSVSYMRGLRMGMWRNADKYGSCCDATCFQLIKPTAMAGYSIYIYHVTGVGAARLAEW